MLYPLCHVYLLTFVLFSFFYSFFPKKMAVDLSFNKENPCGVCGDASPLLWICIECDAKQCDGCRFAWVNCAVCLKYCCSSDHLMQHVKQAHPDMVDLFKTCGECQRLMHRDYLIECAHCPEGSNTKYHCLDCADDHDQHAHNGC